PAITAEPVGFGALHEVDALRELVFISDVVVQSEIVGRESCAGDVGRWIKLEQSNRSLTEARRRDYVVREGLVVERIPNHGGRQDLREIAPAHGGRRRIVDSLGLIAQPVPFVI